MTNRQQTDLVKDLMMVVIGKTITRLESSRDA
jgi:hypothetical protein